MRKLKILKFICLIFACFTLAGGIYLLTNETSYNSEIADETEAWYHKKTYYFTVYYSNGSSTWYNSKYKGADGVSRNAGTLTATLTYTGSNFAGDEDWYCGNSSKENAEKVHSISESVTQGSQAKVYGKRDAGFILGGPYSTDLKWTVSFSPASGFECYSSFYNNGAISFQSSKTSSTSCSSSSASKSGTATVSISTSSGNIDDYYYYYTYVRPKAYTVSYNLGYTNTTHSTKSVRVYNYYTLPTAPTRTGYTFDGWYTSSSGGTKVTSSTLMTKKYSHTLYAHWTAHSYKISYNLDGGSKNGSYWPTTATYGTAFNVSNPTRTGYSFRGWTATGINTSTAKYGSTKSSATNSWTSGTTLVYYSSYMGFNNLTPTNNGTVTLKANWEANGYTLTANANGGSIPSTSGWTGTGTTSTKTVKYDSTYGTLPTPTRTGYTFNNWWTSPSGGSRVYTTTKMNSTSGATIYAHWTPNIYKITLDKQSGSGGTNEIYLKYNTAWCSNSSGTATITSITKPTRTGYTFGGYYTDKNGTGTQIINASGSITGSKTYIASADTLYAKWTANTYSIVFDKNGGSGSMSNQSMTYDKASNLTTNTYTRQGYYFVGWSKTKLGVQSTIPTSNIYKDEASVNNLATSGSITLYAVWLDTWANHATTPTGSGSSTSPYIIDSAEDLAWMINNHGSALKYFKQTKAINLSKYNWYPIGTSDKPFKGVYDGQGYEITNLNILEITNASGNKIQSDIGLFGYTSGGEITGIYIKNATIYGKDNVGLIVSNATSTKINSNIIESSTINASGNYGAVAGKISGGEIKYNLVYVTTNGGTSTSSLYTGSTTLSTNLVENNGTRSKVGTEDLTGWGKVFNRLLPSAISWGAQVFPITSADFTNWVDKTIN